MNTKTIFSIICTTTIAFSMGFASGTAPKGNQKTAKKPVYEWTIPSLNDQFNKDEANFLRYDKANKEIKEAPVAVFMGDSVTDLWAKKRPNFFKENNYVSRGICGQVTTQMLVRFRRDVIDLKPEFVLILAGTNDVARNRGYISEENIVGNIISMCEIAKVNNVKPIICSILPVAEYKWRPVIKSVEPIKRINAMLKKYAQDNNITYLDYYSKLDDGNGGLSQVHALDGVHPTVKCYTIMETMAKQLIDSKRK